MSGRNPVASAWLTSVSGRNLHRVPPMIFHKPLRERQGSRRPQNGPPASGCAPDNAVGAAAASRNDFKCVSSTIRDSRCCSRKKPTFAAVVALPRRSTYEATLSRSKILNGLQGAPYLFPTSRQVGPVKNIHKGPLQTGHRYCHPRPIICITLKEAAFFG